MTVIEHIKALAHGLTWQQREELAEYLKDANGHDQVKVVSLRGSWKDGFAADVDPGPALREIRNEWKRELEIVK